MNMNTQIAIEAFNEGRKAFLEGRSVHFDPYRNRSDAESTFKRNHWVDGWYAAQKAAVTHDSVLGDASV